MVLYQKVSTVASDKIWHDQDNSGGSLKQKWCDQSSVPIVLCRFVGQYPPA